MSTFVIDNAEEVDDGADVAGPSTSRRHESPYMTGAAKAVVIGDDVSAPPVDRAETLLNEYLSGTIAFEDYQRLAASVVTSSRRVRV